MKHIKSDLRSRPTNEINAIWGDSQISHTEAILNNFFERSGAYELHHYGDEGYSRATYL